MAIEVIETPSEAIKSLLLKDIRKRAINAFVKIATHWPPAIESVFRNQGTRDGEHQGGWIRTSPMGMRMRKTFPHSADKKTQANYIKRAPTLIDTRALMKSTEVNFDPNEYADRFEMRVDSSLPYAQIHDQGGPTIIKGKGAMMPQRSIYWITESDKTFINSTVEGAFQNG